jgi:2',3'-cyclic-nucleotide 2'-phosphodiesterase (5'-nucleotidase family)
MAQLLLLLDTGDALVGDGPLGNDTLGEAIVAGMNLMGYDAMALGPKELSLDVSVLEQRMEEARFPMLSANVNWHATGEPVAQPYTILEIDSHRIGIIGLTRPPETDLGAVDILDPGAALARIVPEVEEKADTVVLLTSLPYRSALELARTVPGIDLLIAALPVQLPDRAVRISETGTLAVTAEQPLPRHAGRRVGRLVATLGSNGSLTNEIWTSVPMDRSYPDDPTMKALLDKYR